MSVTPQWRLAADSILVRYEELLGDTLGRLGSIAEALEAPIRREPRTVVEGASITDSALEPASRTISGRAARGCGLAFSLPLSWNGSPGLTMRFALNLVMTASPILS
jgi:hypothetical protein